MLDSLQASGGQVICVGKVADIFAHRGVTQTVKAHGNHAVMDRLLEAMGTAPDRSLLFANCVDFDTSFGHRRDVSGYAGALEDFDAYIPPLRAAMRQGDVAIITADHGCDPTFPGSDHTREYIPALAFGESVTPGPLGRRSGFADIGQSLAAHLGLQALAHGRAFL